MRRVTQLDVAREAGVTRAVVSYVLSNSKGSSIRISEQTRNKVVSIAKELGYRVNLSARSLITRRTQNLAMLVPDLANPFYPMQIKGAQIAAHGAGYRMIIFDSSASSEGEQDFLEMALGGVADGVLLSAFHLSSEEVHQLLDAGIPAVGLIEGLGGTGIDMVETDQRKSIECLVDYLASKGHRSIAHLAGDLSTANGRARLEAYRAALAKHGLPSEDAMVLEGNFLREGTAQLVESWYFGLSPARRPDAMVAANDLMAVEAIKALKQRGVSIPGSLAICGIDNIPEASYVEPSLTTVGQDHVAIGRLATRLLIERIEGREDGAPVHKVLPSQLFVRESA